MLVTKPLVMMKYFPWINLQQEHQSRLLGDYIRDKEAINSKRSRISSLKGFTSHFIDGRVFFRIFKEYFLENMRV